MKLNIAILVFIISTLQVFGQTTETFQADDSALWGLKNRTTNQTVLSPEYDYIYTFIDTNFVKIIQSGKQGVSKTDGTIIIKPEYDKIKQLRNQNFIGTLDSKSALIDHNGKIIIPLQEYLIDLFFNGNYKIYNSKMQSGLINAKGKIILPTEYSFSSTVTHPHIILKNENKSAHYGLVDSLGQLVIPCEYSNIKPIQSGNTYCFKVTKGDEEYVIDPSGHKLDLSQYDNVTSWYGSQPYLRTIKFEDPDKKSVLYGLIDLKGKEIIPPVFQQIHELSKFHLVGTKKNNETSKPYSHLYNKQGKLVFGSKSTRSFRLSNTNNNVIIQFREPNSDLSWYEFYNLEKGKRITSDKYEQIKTLNLNTIALQKLNTENSKYEFQKFKLYNWDGDYLLKSYDSFRLTQPNLYQQKTTYHKRLIEVFNGPSVINGKSIGEKYGLITADGKEVLPCTYDEISKFSKNVAITTKISANNTYKFGLINQDGHIVSEPIYDFIFPPGKIRRSYRDATKLCIVSKTKKKKWGVVNLKNAKLIDAKFDYIDKLNKRTIVFNGTLTKDGDPLVGKYGVANCETGQVSQVKYDFIGEFNPLTKVFIGTLDDIGRPLVGKYGLIDEDGHEVLPIVYDYIAPNKHNDLYEIVFQGEVDDSGFPVFKNGKSYFVSPNGKLTSFQDLGSNTSAIKRISPNTFKNLHTLFVLEKLKSSGHTFKFGILDNQGKVIVPFIYNVIDNFTKEGIAKVGLWSKNQMKYGFINMNGQVITPLDYDYIKINKKHGLHQIFIGKTNNNGLPESGKYGLLSVSGKPLVDPVYSFLGNVNDGLLLAKKDNKFGFINTAGELVIPCIYDKAKRFYYQKSEVELNGETFKIDLKGNRIPENNSTK